LENFWKNHLFQRVFTRERWHKDKHQSKYGREWLRVKEGFGKQEGGNIGKLQNKHHQKNHNTHKLGVNTSKHQY